MGEAREFINISPIARNSNGPILFTLILVKKLSFLICGAKAQVLNSFTIIKSHFPNIVFSGLISEPSAKLALGRCRAACDSVPNLACQMCGVMSEENCHKPLWRAEGGRHGQSEDTMVQIDVWFY